MQLVQLEELRAAADPKVTGVVLAPHAPIDDPLSDKASQLTARIEAPQLEDRLGRFRAESAKSVAVVNGHVELPASSAQGVSMAFNGNSGKTSAGNVADGGFRGWTMLDINPAKGWRARARRPRPTVSAGSGPRPARAWTQSS